MKAVVFGATGLIGYGVLQECLRDPEVTEVLAVGRTPTGLADPGLREAVHADFLDFAPLAGEFAGADACFWCLGVSAVGMDPADYERVTHDYTLAAARTLAEVNPDLTFVYVSGAGTDSSGRGRTRWARVKGRTENAVLALFPNGYAVRPAFVQPVHGVRSRTPLYRWAATALTPVAPVLRRLFPSVVVTTGQLGRAVLGLARHGHPGTRVLENRDLVAFAESEASRRA
ncbi:epimerase [Kitasatospora sp. NBC_01539]|uniref:epimerase n=1 Tax=Kitasatospora sp. NBC_01539 TaxID=2903577 RepID=UPI0038602043